MNTADTYLIKALENYPYNVEEAMGAIEYGLAYNAEHPALLCLMGRVYAEQLHQYKNACMYFEDALVADLDYPETYYHYIGFLIRMEELTKAEKLITQAFKVTGIDKYSLYIHKSTICEQREQLKEALEMITEARRHSYNKQASDFLDEEVTRINKKIDLDTKDENTEEPRKYSFFKRWEFEKKEKK